MLLMQTYEDLVKFIESQRYDDLWLHLKSLEKSQAVALVPAALKAMKAIRGGKIKAPEITQPVRAHHPEAFLQTFIYAHGDWSQVKPFWHHSFYRHLEADDHWVLSQHPAWIRQAVQLDEHDSPPTLIHQWLARGLCDPPPPGRYYSRFPFDLVNAYRLGSTFGHPTLAGRLMEMPGMLSRDIWIHFQQAPTFRDPPGTDSLQRIYDLQEVDHLFASQLGANWAWRPTLVQLAREGALDSSRLADALTSVRDHPQARPQLRLWCAQTLEDLNPSTHSLAPQIKFLLPLLAANQASVNDTLFPILAKEVTAGRIPLSSALQACHSHFSAPAKKMPLAILKLIQSNLKNPLTPSPTRSKPPPSHSVTPSAMSRP
jgi:hypothetical protein